MEKLIKEATQLIYHHPIASASIFEVLTKWDDEMKQAFILAWKLLKEKDD